MSNIEAVITSLRQGLSPAAITSVLERITEYAETVVRSNTPTRSGVLRDHTHREVVTTECRGRVWNDSPVAQFVHDGTRPHEIRPKSPNGVLVFTIGGKKVFTRRVFHPGTKAQPWFEQSLPAIQAQLETLAAQSLVLEFDG